MTNKNNNYEITLYNESNYTMFDNIVKILKNNTNIELIESIDGLDEKYYDFKFQNKEFCLHLQHDLGIFLITKDLSMKNDLKRISENILVRLKNIY